MYAARFDTLIGHSVELSERRRRLMSSALMAATLSLAAGTFAWVGDAMGVSAVAPPSTSFQVTLSVFEAPPPPPVPSSPAGAAAASTDDEPVPEEPVDVEPDPPPAELELVLDPPPVRGSRTHEGPPDPGAGSGKSPFGGTSTIGLGTGACALPPCVGTETTTTPPWTTSRPTPPAEEQQRLPFEAVRARAISTPDPDQLALGRTKTGRMSRRGGKSSVSFCISEKGKTFDVRTSRAFGNDPEIDRICRAAVSRWRFVAMKVGGRARTTCTTTTFEIQFD